MVAGQQSHTRLWLSLTSSAWLVAGREGAAGRHGEGALGVPAELPPGSQLDAHPGAHSGGHQP